ncbi:unnamed protein product [Rotaria sp. Silwood1]|nr:unnamed protein product [Rotaria sp. Silwood1]CAF3749930.1 unnamed protein product [Rotaria sp. Silwood1]CAF3798573.1 unnamed protein product [Rotaria sp. Silwood1]CAF4712277.1 unnamed protein product [Rotaria sp. Silwood1]CAF4882271.1 unnamed protein product [Rotaria sp. Silwood1]
MKERILAETTSITKIYDEEIVKANVSKGATAIIPTIVDDQQLHLLFESATIFMDGTLDITPAHFKQVYLIHTEKFDQGLPIAFFLLPNKRGKTYLELFE